MRSIGHSVLLGLILWALALAATANAQSGTTQTFTTLESEFTPGVRNQGWWDPRFPNHDENENYIADEEHRNFFTFDLTSACRAASATLDLTRFDQIGAVEYSLWDVSTPPAILNFNEGGGSPTIFEDLGSGTTFGSFVVEPGEPTDVVSFPLNEAGVVALNSARGGFFSIGGAGFPQLLNGYVFGLSDDGGTQRLVLQCLPELPADKQECKRDGWRDFAIFKNQGECVASVARSTSGAPSRFSS